MDVVKAIRIMCPTAVFGPGGPVEVRDDGSGAFISVWDAGLGEQPTPEQMQAALDQHGDDFDKPLTVDKLWEACTAYQTGKMDANGVAAMLGKAMQATLAGTPHTKADANIAWWQTLWGDYETRRAAVLGGDLNPSFDFSAHGDIPYRVAEAMAES